MPERPFAPGDVFTVECPHLFKDEAASCGLCGGHRWREQELNVRAALVANAAAELTVEAVNVQMIDRLEGLAHRHSGPVPRSEIFALVRSLRSRLTVGKEASDVA